MIRMKSLVVFYSRTGNAKWAAETVAAHIGADIEEVVDLKKRSGVAGWIGGGRAARSGKETEISPTQKSYADYDLIVLGSHGRRGMRRFFLGSVAESVVRSAEIPVLVARTAVAHV